MDDMMRLRNRDELVVMAARLGLFVADSESKESIADRVRLLTTAIKPAKHGEIVKARPAPLSEKDVRSALAKWIKAGVEIEFGEGCWELRKGKGSECGSMTMPLAHIKRAAEDVARRG